MLKKNLLACKKNLEGWEGVFFSAQLRGYCSQICQDFTVDSTESVQSTVQCWKIRGQYLQGILPIMYGGEDTRNGY